ncbi:hypothetical protein JT06_11045 [Desulfobulbus sp. Tol-SR]|nr:hypothetical protein JT06_11045 [Desulfobulbus sp. Tol-SR]
MQSYAVADLLLEDEALRDGLQIESRIFTIGEKIELFDYLRDAGLKRIQVGSFVHPRIVPQMADTDALIRTLGKQPGTVVSVLILNDRGLERALACGVEHVSMSVSIALVAAALPGVRISLHLHDTRGLGLANMLAGYEAGVRTFDVCAGGLGGCPFVKGAAGNVPTEDAVNMFDSMGIATGISLPALMPAVEFLETTLGRALPGRMKRVLAFQRACSAETGGAG